MSGAASETLVVAHETADFDALAAAVAARMLYPGAVIGLGRHLARPVRDFVSLHKDRFPLARCAKLDLSAIRELVVVDTMARSRVRHAEPVLARRDGGEPITVRVWDHHPEVPDPIPHDELRLERVGAVTTLLVEELDARGIHPDPVTATLLALGVHDDTGSLVLAHTTPRDVRALAWLLEHGAKLDVVARFLRPAFEPGQRHVLARILEDTTRHDVGGASIAVSIVDGEAAVEGLAEVVAEAMRLEGHEALFALVRVAPSKLIVVGRAATRAVDVGASMRALGGGGHRGAGSAVARGEPLEVRERLLAALAETRPRARSVVDVMSRDVVGVLPSMPIDDLAALLETRRHSGAPIVDEAGELVGVISRRDVERAQSASRGHLPASSHMSRPARTIGASASLEDALAEMTRNDVGRLPVVADGALVGIVTRSDVLRALYS